MSSDDVLQQLRILEASEAVKVIGSWLGEHSLHAVLDSFQEAVLNDPALNTHQGGMTGGAPQLKPKLLRFVIVGSVDDGKSTLIGRMLYDTNMVYDDQIEAAQKASSMEDGSVDQVEAFGEVKVSSYECVGD